MAERITIKVKFLAKTARYNQGLFSEKHVPIHSYYLYLFWKKDGEYKLFYQTDENNKRLKDAQGNDMPVVAKPDASNPEVCDYPFVRGCLYFAYFSGRKLSLQEAQDLADKRNHLFIKLLPRRQKTLLDDSLFYWITIFQKIEKEQSDKLKALKYIYELYAKTKTPQNNEEKWLVNHPHLVLPDGQPCHMENVAVATYLYVKDDVNAWKSRINDVSTETVTKLQTREGVPMSPLQGTYSLSKHLFEIDNYSANVHSYVLNTTEETKLKDNTTKIAGVFEDHFNQPNISMKTGHDFMDLISGVENGFTPVSDNQVNFLQCKNDLHNMLNSVQVSGAEANFTKGIILKNNVDGIAAALQQMTGAHIPTSNIINKYGVVWLKKESVSTAALTDSDYYLFLYDKPAKRPSGKVLKELPLNTRLFVKSMPVPGWYQVTTGDNLSGYVEARYVNLRMPDYYSKIYQIKADDSGNSIINKFKKTDDTELYLAHVLLFINNPDNNKPGAGIRVNQDGFDLWTDTSLSDLQKFQVFETRWIWLPSRELIDGLQGVMPSGSITQALKDKISKPISDFLTKYLPVGQGVSLDLAGGLTFGIPLGVDARYDTYIYRKDDTTITLVRNAAIEPKLDTGLGVGAFAVVSGKKRGNNTVAGAKLSAGASAGVSLNTHFEYDFRIDNQADNDAIIGLLYIAFSPSTVISSLTSTVSEIIPDAVSSVLSVVFSPVTFAMDLFAGMLSKLFPDPDKYLTKSKISLGVSGEASANAILGLNIFKQNRSQAKPGQTLSKGNLSLNYSDLNDLNPNFMAELNLSGEASLLTGIEIDKAKHEFTKFVYAHIGAEFELEMPFTDQSEYLRHLLFIGVNDGYKFTTITKPNQIETKSVSTYSNNGEWDKFDGHGNIITIIPNAEPASILDLKTVTNEFANFDDLYTYYTQTPCVINYKKRVFIPLSALTFGLSAFQSEMTDFLSNFKEKNKTVLDYIGSDLYLTFEFQYDHTAIKDILLLIKNIIGSDVTRYRSINDLPLILEKIAKDIIKLSTGDNPAVNIPQKYVDLFLMLFHADRLINADGYFELYIAAAAGGKFAAGVKVRAEGSVKASTSLRKNITKPVKAILKQVDKRSELIKFILEIVLGSMSENLTKATGFDDPHSNSWAGLNWSKKWIDLDKNFNLKIPFRTTGLYRVRKKGTMKDLAYIGMTYSCLQERTMALKRVINKTYLTQDPEHRKGGVLWFFRKFDNDTFEISVTKDSNRKGRQLQECREEALIHLHRIKYNCTPLVNCGRKHHSFQHNKNQPPYYIPRPNGRYDFPSIDVIKDNGQDILSKTWLGLDEWREFWYVSEYDKDPLLDNTPGIYRIAKLDNNGDATDIVYFGMSKELKNRFRDHNNNPILNSFKYSFFKIPQAERLTDRFPHQLFERETDLIGAYFLIMGKSPEYQTRAHQK